MEVDPDATREILMVLAVAVTGLLLAAFAAFNPWYARSTGTGRQAVVEMSVPEKVDQGNELVTYRTK